jgi:hypothetical protein
MGDDRQHDDDREIGCDEQKDAFHGRQAWDRAVVFKRLRRLGEKP